MLSIALTYLTDMESFKKKHMEFNVEEFANQVKKVKPKRRVQVLERKLQDCLQAFKGNIKGLGSYFSAYIFVLHHSRRLCCPCRDWRGRDAEYHDNEKRSSNVHT